VPRHGAVYGRHLQPRLHHRRPYIGGSRGLFLQGVVSDSKNGTGTANGLAPTIPETVYACFQMTFAIITPALIAGAFAERMKFSPCCGSSASGRCSSMRRSPIGCGGRRTAANVDDKGNSHAWFKVLDFAGGTVVHVNAGVAGLMCALMLGKRKDTGATA
jgi:Amt family ammonium transporter